jgi:hypothetical protein
MIRLVLLAACLGAAAPALAARDEAQPTWGFSFRSGPYQPSMGSNAPYYRAFYTSPKDGSLFKNHPLLSEIEVDWYIFSDIGLLGPMLQVGLWGVSGNTQYCVHGGVKGPCSADEILTTQSTSGPDSTKLTVYPITLGAIYKLDQIKRYTVIPLVPYAKGGLSYFIWRNTVGGSISHYLGHPAEGATLGFRGTIGLAFNLDFIEPSAASRARMSTGIADSYLFGEMSFLWVDGFGDKKRLDFSGNTIQVGFAVDFL